MPAEPAPPTIAPVPSTRMSEEAGGFLNACGVSAVFRGYLEARKAGASAQQGNICTCLTSTLMAEVSPSDLTLLARDFAPAPAPAGGTSPTYDAAASAASGGLRTCMTSAGVPADF
jgi:hypothetical protein